MNSLGIFTDSIILKSNTQNLFINRLIPISEGYIGLGQISNLFDSKTFFWVFRLDKKLQRIQDTVLPISKSFASPSFAFDKDSNIIFSISELSRTNYFGKIDKNGFVKSWKIDFNSPWYFK